MIIQLRKKDKKIGIIGGSFNPIHTGHLIIADWFKDALNLDKVIFIPAYISPFKTDESRVIDPAHRLNMVQLAISTNKSFICEDYEVNKKTVSYSYDTLTYLKNKYINSEMHLLIGEDQAFRFNQWFNWREILRFVRLCIAGREFDAEQFRLIKDFFDAVNYSPIYIDSPKIEISSTEIRKRRTNNKSIKYLVTDNVYNYIIDNDLYKSE